MSTLSYRTECTIMSLAAAIQVMWIVWISTWESKCGSQTAQTAGQPKWSLVPREMHDWSQFVFISVWPRFLAVQMQYGCSPWETTCCISEYCPSKAPSQNASDTDRVLNWFLEEMISMKMDLRYTQLQKCVNVFWYACHSFGRLVIDMEPRQMGHRDEPLLFTYSIKK